MLPFSVFLRGNRPYYYVAFKNDETGKYLPAISTKKTTEATAIKQAWVWYREGIPHKGGALDIKTFSLQDAVHRAVISPVRRLRKKMLSVPDKTGSLLNRSGDIIYWRLVGNIYYLERNFRIEA
jgi:hypothetical protein